MGAYIMRADEMAKRLMKEDNQLKQQIIEAFGDQSYNTDGSLNRGYLAREAFENNRVQELNALVHPHVRQATREEIKNAEKKNFELFVKEAALLLQHDRPEYLDIIVLVKADPEKRIQWVAQRDGVAPEQVRARMQWQQSDQSMEQMTDYIISNDGTINELKTKARKLIEELKASES